MNFFGHLAAALQVSDDRDFLLGAMAPDLLPLCGAQAGAATCGAVAAGQAHHWSMDGIFHATPAFVTLQAWAARTLIEKGVRRGPSRGAAHVGIELFLDGFLATRTDARAAFARCLIDAETTRVPFVWADELSSRRWRGMIGRLRGGAIPAAYRDTDFVGARLVGALGGRPRLALTDDAAAILRGFLPALQRRVTEDAEGLLAGTVVGGHANVAPAAVVLPVAQRAAPPATSR